VEGGGGEGWVGGGAQVKQGPGGVITAATTLHDFRPCPPAGCVLPRGVCALLRLVSRLALLPGAGPTAPADRGGNRSLQPRKVHELAAT